MIKGKNPSYYDVNTSNTATVSSWFNESYIYDNRGNIMYMYRNGYYQDGAICTFGRIDHLAYSYTSNTNRLASISDATSLAAAKARGFNPGAGGAGYTYDGNGNLKSDSYKSITNISYNHLNLPRLITFSNGNSIEIVYDAADNKLRKIVKQGSTVQYEQDYAGGIEYRKTPASGTFRIEAIYHEEGRYFNLNVDASNTVSWRKEYALRDHLGNTRIMFADKNANGTVEITGNASTNEILQENHYYPFGLNTEGPWMNDAARDNRYQYNGKEWNDDFGLNWNDYGARWYDAAIARFNHVDPLAEKYYAWSPYNYVLGNPIRFIDPDGRAARPPDDYYDQNGNFLYRDNQITDNIRIINSSDWASIQSTYIDQLGDKSQSHLGMMKALDAKSTIVSDANISAEAWSNITTNILSSMDDVDVSKLYNGRVSVLNYNTPGAESKFNDPTNFGSVANVDPKTLRETGDIKLTVYLWSGSADSELRTVSNVKNTLGAHEYLGHGVKKYSDKTNTHHKAYELQMNHPSWQGTTPDFKQYQTEKYNEYKRREK